MQSKTIKNIVITGGNQGIGYGIIDSLLNIKNEEYKIILCTRNIENGTKSKEELIKKHGDNINTKLDIVKLDINSEQDIEDFILTIKEKYNSKIDCLVNNAGTSINTSEFSTRVFDITVGTNFYSTVKFTETVISNNLISNEGKIIFIGSSVGRLGNLKKKDLALRFMDKELNYEKLYQLSIEFRLAIENKTWENEGWPGMTYCVSKILINKYAKVLSLRKDILEKNIQVYSCCPGWVRTNMGGEKAHRSIEEGVVCPVFLINKEYKLDMSIQGEFFYDCKVSSLDTYKI